MLDSRLDFSGGPVVNNLPADAGDMGSILEPATRSHMMWNNYDHVPRLLKPQL